MDKEYWNHVDILALAVASTKSTRFDADPDKWHTLIYEFVKNSGDKYPEIFRHFVFSFRPGMAPYCDQLDHFFFVMGVAGKMVTYSPDYDVREMPKKTKADILERKKHLLDKYQEPIEQMAGLIDQEIGLPPSV